MAQSQKDASTTDPCARLLRSLRLRNVCVMYFIRVDLPEAGFPLIQ